ncbi:Mss4p nuclear export [Coemansia sp. RSA 552]|nr:Mss4p nuclear export [Coemansia sp. RSA 552]
MSRKRLRDDEPAEPEQVSDAPEPEQASDASESDTGSSDSEPEETVMVDFEFFDPRPTDFHAVKRMLQSSFGDDNEEFGLSELTDLILEQNLIGSMVKVDGGEDADPYAFMTVLGMDEHKERTVMKQLREYLLKKAEKAQVSGQLQKILDSSQVGFLLNERVVNVPPDIVVPMLRMLQEETQRATAAGEPFDFDYYLVICPMYRETEAEDSDASDDGARKRRPRKEPLLDAYAHAEDEILEEYAALKFDYKFTRMKRVAESRNSFADTGIVPSRRCLLIPKSKFQTLITRIETLLNSA